MLRRLALSLLVTLWPALGWSAGNPLSPNPVLEWEGNINYSATAASLLQVLTKRRTEPGP